MRGPITQDQLEQKRIELSDRLRRIRRDRRRADGPLEPDFSEQAVQKQNDEVLDALEATTAEDLKHVTLAMERYDAGLYGICDQCGEAIDFERLRALPYTSLCRSCAAQAGDRQTG